MACYALLQLVEPLKLGVFTSALVSDVPSKTVWTQEALELLAPAMTKALWRLRVAPTLPAEALLVVGRYLDGSVSVDIEGGHSLVLRLGVHASPLNLTLISEASTPNLRAFRAAPAHSTQACRWLDDGSDLEIAYFHLPNATARASSLRFMSGLFDRFL